MAFQGTGLGPKAQQVSGADTTTKTFCEGSLLTCLGLESVYWSILI